MFNQKEYQRNYQRKYLLERWHRLRKEWFDKNGPCIDCGSNDNLELDHVSPATKISNKIWFWKPERRQKELEKCVARCKECHKLKTTKEQMTQIKHRPVGRYWRPSRCKCKECRPELYVSNAAVV